MTHKLDFEVHPGQSSLIDVSSCIVVEGTGSDGQPTARPYTPVSPNWDTQRFSLIVKSYLTGNVSRRLGSLNVGDTIRIKGAYPKLRYEANKYKRLVMIAGGSGITPMIQLLNAIADNPEDHTEVILLFSNKSTLDFVTDPLLTFKTRLGDRLKVNNFYTDHVHGNLALSNSIRGHITKESIKSLCPPSSDPDTFVYVCGPDRMVEALAGNKNKDGSQGPLTGILKDLWFQRNERLQILIMYG